MKINVHAGHNPDGKTAFGAVGIVKESTEARSITANVIEKLRAAGHTVYDCTVDDGTSQNDVLKKIVAKCNEHTVDLDISIHLNSGRNDYVGDGSTGGTEVFCHGLDSKAVPYAQEVAREISALGFRLRDDSVKDDIKTSSTLYVLKNTKAPAMLIESFFVDDKDDVALYQKVGGADGIAEAIVKGILKAEEAKQEAEEARADENDKAKRIAEADEAWDKVAAEINAEVDRICAYLDGRDTKALKQAAWEKKAGLLLTITEHYEMSVANKMRLAADRIQLKLLPKMKQIQEQAKR